MPEPGPYTEQHIVGTGASATIGITLSLATVSLLTVTISQKDVTVDPVSVFFGPQEMTKKTDKTEGTAVRMSVWELQLPAITTEDVVVTFSGSTEFHVCAIGWIYANAYVGSATASGTGTGATVPYTGTKGNIMIGFITVSNAAPTTITSEVDFTEYVTGVNTANMRTVGGTKAPRLGDDVDWTLGASQTWAGTIVEYSQIITPLDGNVYISPTNTGTALVVPGFVVRETVQIESDDSITVEALI